MRLLSRLLLLGMISILSLSSIDSLFFLCALSLSSLSFASPGFMSSLSLPPLSAPSPPSAPPLSTPSLLEIVADIKTASNVRGWQEGSEIGAGHWWEKNTETENCEEWAGRRVGLQKQFVLESSACRDTPISRKGWRTSRSPRSGAQWRREHGCGKSSPVFKMAASGPRTSNL